MYLHLDNFCLSFYEVKHTLQLKLALMEDLAIPLQLEASVATEASIAIGDLIYTIV